MLGLDWGLSATSSSLPRLHRGTGRMGCQQRLTTVRFWQGQSTTDVRAPYALTKPAISHGSSPVLSFSELVFAGEGNLGLVPTGHVVSSRAAPGTLQAHLLLSSQRGAHPAAAGCLRSCSEGAGEASWPLTKDLRFEGVLLHRSTQGKKPLFRDQSPGRSSPYSSPALG